jgi:hypothetical protein
VPTPVPYQPALFDYGRTTIDKPLPVNLGFAGFRPEVEELEPERPVLVSQEGLVGPEADVAPGIVVEGGDQDGPFRLQLFHLGFLYTRPVVVNVVRDGVPTPVAGAEERDQLVEHARLVERIVQPETGEAEIDRQRLVDGGPGRPGRAVPAPALPPRLPLYPPGRRERGAGRGASTPGLLSG